MVLDPRLANSIAQRRSLRRVTLRRVMPIDTCGRKWHIVSTFFDIAGKKVTAFTTA